MASKQTETPKKGTPKQKEIEAETEDIFQAHARVQEETSNDGKFSTYEYAPKKDPLAGDLILQYRGAPKKG